MLVNKYNGSLGTLGQTHPHIIKTPHTVSRGWVKKKFTKVLLHTAKMIEPRVKKQARGQDNGSRALK